ncbi:hypothetical protein ACQJBY_037122 [Aegilops geniculata]
MKWKRQRDTSASSSSYCEDKLLEFFNSDTIMQPIFVFLRLVAAVWICSHSDYFEPLIADLGETYKLQDWCFQNVIPCGEWADHLAVMALATALEIPLRVKHLNGGPAQDIYTGQGVPAVHVILLLYSGNYHDIIYPVHSSSETLSVPGTKSDSQCQSYEEVGTASLPSAARGLTWQALPGTAGAVPMLIRPVWHENSEEELEGLRLLLQQGSVTVALDMEFMSTAGNQVRPGTMTKWYSNVCDLVNGGDVLQLGLAISLDTDSPPEAVRVNEINLQIDVNSRPYNKDTIKFLTNQKHNLDAHNTGGVPPAQLVDWLLNEFDRFYDREVTWVFFQGDYDVAFLLNLVGNFMPATLVEHMRRYTCSLPQLYDVRVLSRILFGKDAGSLDWLADKINVQRTGNRHSSGSVALLTLDCFFELRRRLGIDSIRPLRGVLCGLYDVDHIISKALPMGHANLLEIEVWRDNFDGEASVIAQAVQSNYYIVGVDVCFSPALGHRLFHEHLQGCFELMVEALTAVGYYEISLALVSYTGQLPKGRWWRFHVSECVNTDAAQYIHFPRFVELLHRCNLINDERIIWATYEGAECIASLCRMVQRRGTRTGVPLTVRGYLQCRSSIFPSLYDIGLLVSREKGNALADIARRLGLSVPGNQSGWNAVLSAQVMVRLREQLEESDALLLAYKDHRGKLLARCCPSFHLHH